MIKILFVGSLKYPMYVNAFYKAALDMEEISAQIFDTDLYFKDTLIYRIEQNLACGLDVLKLNLQLKKIVKRGIFNIIFFYSTRLISESTMKYIKKKGIFIGLYNNDNPFSMYFKKYFWRKYRTQIRYADITYVYRESNIADAKKYCAQKVSLLRSYYIKERNYYIPDKEIKLDCPEVLFLGHKELDGREKYIKALLDEEIFVGVPQYEWADFEVGNKHLIKLKDTHQFYNEYLNKCKIAVVFLSSINQDTYTRRCFEIPAVKTLMIAPRTEDILTLFKEKTEVITYSTINEFVDKIKYYLKNDKERDIVAINGYNRLIQDGHEAADRVKQIISDYKDRNNKIMEEAVQ